MSISTGSICSNRLIRVAVPISGAAVATVAPRAVAARIATVTCALFGPIAAIGVPAVIPALASAVAAYIVLLAAHARGFAGYWRTPAVLRTPEGRAAVDVPGNEHVIGLLHLGPPRQQSAVLWDLQHRSCLRLPHLDHAIADVLTAHTD